MEINDERYFMVRTMEQVIKDGSKKPDRKKICGAFLYQDTTTLLFSRTNYGKSLLAFQFAYAAATGSNFDSCNALLNECEPMKVLMIDLELEDKDISDRHRIIMNDKNPYLTNLLYLHEKIENRMMVGFELLDKIEKCAVEFQARLLIIDNISKLLPDALKPDTATFIISILNRIRKATGCSIFVIGHTTKGNPKLAVQPTDYFGSAMMQNFFSELSFLDMTRDGNYFLCHSKTKHKECYNEIVPVLSRGDHPRFGVGFTFLNLQSLSQIQLPFSLMPVQKQRSRNLQKFRNEISLLLSHGMTQKQVAELCDCSQAAISKVINAEEVFFIGELG